MTAETQLKRAGGHSRGHVYWICGCIGLAWCVTAAAQAVPNAYISTYCRDNGYPMSSCFANRQDTRTVHLTATVNPSVASGTTASFGIYPDSFAINCTVTNGSATCNDGGINGTGAKTMTATPQGNNPAGTTGGTGSAAAFVNVWDDGQPEKNVVTNISVRIGAEPAAATASFTGKVSVPAHSRSHNIGLKVNGAVVGTGTSTQINSAKSSEATFGTSRSVSNGDTFEWVVDGFGQGATTVQLNNTGTVENPVWNYGPVVFESNVPGGDGPTPRPALTPSPSPSPTGTPFAMATPQANGSPPTAAVISQPGWNGQSAVNSGAVVVVNPQDIYSPIVDALKNKGGVQRQADLPNMEGERGSLDQLAAKNADNIAKINGAATQSSAMVTEAGNKFQGWATASFGTVSVIDLPLNAFNSRFPSSVAVPPFFGTIRKVILWLLVALWYFMAVRYVIALKVG